MSQSNAPKQDLVDLTNCDREPIHIPGRIQPYGVLLVLDPVYLTIVQVSANSLLLLNRSTDSLLGTSFEVLVQPDQRQALRTSLVNEETKYTRPLLLSIDVGNERRLFHGVMHRNPDALFILELQPATTADAASLDFYEMVRTASSGLQNTGSLNDLCQVMTQEIKRLTAFDRVLVYKFDEDGHGIVVAEAMEADMESYLGLHYPASDIPKQARQLYLLNWLRLIADVDYKPVDIVPILHPTTQKPIDLTYAFLRGVSPIHLEYLKNMGVAASMSISLIKRGQLWGLIACHHRTTRYLSYETRTACEFLGQLFSIQLETRQENEDFRYQVKVKNALMRCVEQVTVKEDYIQGLFTASTDLLNMTAAHGAALCRYESIQTVGITPNEEQIRDIISNLVSTNTENVFHTHKLAQSLPNASAIREKASGLLAITISKSQGSYILWFRPEVIQTVTWAGNPEKPVEVTDGENVRLSPRKSFAAWQQQVELTSLPWQPSELAAAEELRNAIIEVVLRNLEKLTRVNAELERSNSELDSFAYIASHDLKEPLRGIHNYATFLMQDYQSVLDEEGIAKLRTLVRLTQRMEDLINSLLHFSRVGRVDMAIAEVSLQSVLAQALELLQARIQAVNIAIRVPRALPHVRCDAIRVGEVFNNLITNAIKYNDKPEKWIEIGYLDQQPVVYYVRDNGIGIRDKHHETIFRIFKRLHGRDEYGGGTGSGLTIARKIIERHGGRIWVESVYGEGATFYFTLEGNVSR